MGNCHVTTVLGFTENDEIITLALKFADPFGLNPVFQL